MGRRKKDGSISDIDSENTFEVNEESQEKVELEEITENVVTESNLFVPKIPKVYPRYCGYRNPGEYREFLGTPKEIEMYESLGWRVQEKK